MAQRIRERITLSQGSLLGLLAILTIFLLSNLSPSLPLVILGSATRPFPLAIWIGLAMAVGAIWAWILDFCLAQMVAAAPRARSRERRDRAYNSRYDDAYDDKSDPFEFEDDDLANDWVDEELTPRRPFQPINPPRQNPGFPSSQASPQPSPRPAPSKFRINPDPQDLAPEDDEAPWEDPNWVENGSDWEEPVDELDDWEEFEARKQAVATQSASPEPPAPESQQPTTSVTQAANSPTTPALDAFQASESSAPAKHPASDSPDAASNRQDSAPTNPTNPPLGKSPAEPKSPAQGSDRLFEVPRQPRTSRQSGSSYSYRYKESRRNRDRATNDSPPSKGKSGPGPRPGPADRPGSNPARRKPRSPARSPVYNPQAGRPDAVYDADYRIITPPRKRERPQPPRDPAPRYPEASRGWDDPRPRERWPNERRPNDRQPGERRPNETRQPQTRQGQTRGHQDDWDWQQDEEW